MRRRVRSSNKGHTEWNLALSSARLSMLRQHNNHQHKMLPLFILPCVPRATRFAGWPPKAFCAWSSATAWQAMWWRCAYPTRFAACAPKPRHGHARRGGSLLLRTSRSWISLRRRNSAGPSMRGNAAAVSIACGESLRGRSASTMLCHGREWGVIRTATLSRRAWHATRRKESGQPRNICAGCFASTGWARPNSEAASRRSNCLPPESCDRRFRVGREPDHCPCRGALPCPEERRAWPEPRRQLVLLSLSFRAKSRNLSSS